jgi:hypothetical protein
VRSVRVFESGSVSLWVDGGFFFFYACGLSCGMSLGEWWLCLDVFGLNPSFSGWWFICFGVVWCLSEVFISKVVW